MVRNRLNATYIIVTKIFIDWCSVYGCKLLVTSRLHSDPIIIMDKIFLTITNRTHVHALHYLSHLSHLLSYHLSELLEFGSRNNFPVTNNVVIEVVTIIQVGHRIRITPARIPHGFGSQKSPSPTSGVVGEVCHRCADWS